VSAVGRKAKGPPVVLSIAGSDNSAGAGLQADLKTIGARGCYALTAVTCVVAEVPGKVSSIQPIRPDIVAEQVRLSFEAFPVSAVKTGMLYSTPIIEAVADALMRNAEKSDNPPALVVDPVMVASSGEPLLRRDAVAAYSRTLFPIADLVTPNLDELSILAGGPITDLDSMIAAGRQLAESIGSAFLLKGGHLKGKIATDVLVLPSGGIHHFHAPFIRGIDPHGTGCTYSAAIAAGLASGLDLVKAVGAAKKYITAALAGHLRWGSTIAIGHSAKVGR